MKLFGLLCLSAALVMGAEGVTDAEAAQFRNLKIIAAPTPPPPGFEAVEPAVPLDPRLVEKAVCKLIEAWNSADLERMLSDSFVDKSRLLDSLAENIPRDARLRILAIRGIQTLEQFAKPESETSQLVQSRVSAIANTQLEFNDPVQGFQILEGTVEYVFDVTARVTRAKQ